MPSETENAVAELHAFYCERSGLQTRLCFAQRAWYDRLRDYDFNADALRADIDLLVRYLKREIARDKRNMGALKLSNLLQPDQFDEDVALARLAMKKKDSPQRHRGAESSTKLLTPHPDTEVGWRGPEAVAKLREFRNSLGKPK
jgi:hypothetical protein